MTAERIEFFALFCFELKGKKYFRKVKIKNKLKIAQGTYNTIGSTLFCFRKSKQIISLLEGWAR
jgi:hypothetical protein